MAVAGRNGMVGIWQFHCLCSHDGVVGTAKRLAPSRDVDGFGGVVAAGRAHHLLFTRDGGARFDADEEPVPLADAGGDGRRDGTPTADGQIAYPSTPMGMPHEGLWGL